MESDDTKSPSPFTTLTDEIAGIKEKLHQIDTLLGKLEGEAFDDDDRTFVRNKKEELYKVWQQRTAELEKKQEIYRTQIAVFANKIAMRKSVLSSFSQECPLFSDDKEFLDYFARKQVVLNDQLAAVKDELMRES